jgi:Flp pilus assembly protein TadG
MSTTPRHRTSTQRPRGQILVIVAVGMVVIVAAVGLVIDSGYAWGKQRQTQNAADAAAEAGAVVLAQRIAGAQPLRSDADVAAAVARAGSENGVGTPDGFYTDLSGNLLDSAGASVASRSDAAVVGGGAIPPNTAGVQAVGTQTFPTFLARVLGVDQFTTAASATAVAGYLSEVCSAEDGCDVLPVAVPMTVLGCDGQNNPQPVVPAAFWVPTANPIIVPLCKNGPGNVGWLDWRPPGGGTRELEQSIRYPDNDAMTIPDWFFVTSTGNVNSILVEDALNETWAGKVVKIPQFDVTCDTQPNGTTVDACPAGHVGGNGQNQWYHVPQFAAFQFCGGSPNPCAGTPYGQGAYVNGNNSTICDTGNGATSCLVGRFVYFIDHGTVGPGTGGSSPTGVLGVQLIK